MPNRSTGLFSRGRGGWLTIMLAVLVAFSWQSFLIQTHRHYGNETFSTVSSAAADAASQRPDRKAPSGLPDKCSICREVAHAGQLVLPQAFDFELPAQTDFRFFVPASADRALAQRSHAWQSRAPPSPLQA